MKRKKRRKITKKGWFFTLLAILIVLLSSPEFRELLPFDLPQNIGGLSGISSKRQCGRRVARVVDGDTIKLTDGERVRYIGIDTPEMDWKRGRHEPYALEATERNRSLTEGREICLEFDREDRDRYGRLLAYVYSPDGEMINRRLLEEGLATRMIVPPNDRYAAEFLQIERTTRVRRLGIWKDGAAAGRKRGGGR